MKEIGSTISEIVLQMKETEEAFIFRTIRPFCEQVIERTIMKQELVEALIKSKKMNMKRADRCPRCDFKLGGQYKGRTVCYCLNCGQKINRYPKNNT